MASLLRDHSLGLLFCPWQGPLSGRSHFQTNFPHQVPAKPHPLFGSHMAQIGCQEVPLCITAWLPKFVPENSPCVPQPGIQGWFSIPVPTSPSLLYLSISFPDHQGTGLHCPSLATS